MPTAARLLVGAPNALHEARVRFVQQPHRQRQSRRVGELRSREAEGVQVVADLLDVCAPWPLVALGLEGEQIDEGRLRALDLRGDHGLLADEGVDEPIERRHHLTGKLESGERLLRCSEPLVERAFDGELRPCGRQWRRNEGLPPSFARRCLFFFASSPRPARNELVPWALQW